MRACLVNLMIISNKMIINDNNWATEKQIN